MGHLPLNALHAFEQAARLSSLKLAAEALHRSPSAISHHIRHLEALLDQAVFIRGHRELSLTPAGQALFDAVHPAFQALRAAVGVRGSAVGRTLKVSLAWGFAKTFVLPWFSELQDLLPDHRIALEVSSEKAEVGVGGVDVAVRFGPRPRGDFDVVQLRADQSCIVAAPEWFAASGRLKRRPENAVLLGQTQQPTLWDQALHHIGARHSGTPLLFDSFAAVLEAAERGMGLALAPESVCQPQIEAGRLQADPRWRFDNGWAWWLISRRNGRGLRAIDIARRWLVERCRAG